MSGPGTLTFLKMNGLGNEIVVVDVRDSNFTVTPDLARRMAADPRSHFDQLMVLGPPRTKGTDAFVTIFNTDGSESAACGNGTRCIGWTESRKTGRSALKFETKAGILDVAVANRNRITVDMGEPRFDWLSIPLAEPFHDTRGIELQIGPIDNPVLHSPAVVNVGNPHAVFFVDNDPYSYDLARLGPMLENHPIFPERANISIARVEAPNRIRLRTWERGAGLTKACGTAACAAAVTAARKRLAQRTVTVMLPGGDLDIAWTDNNRILMTGPAEFEYDGQFSLGGAAAGA
ncbi:MAG: diaminopimelate epimerase [Hyphomicrobium sp.]|nr:diaminopimelate epimerase [Hyphomicrobium sp.]